MAASAEKVTSTQAPETTKPAQEPSVSPVAGRIAPKPSETAQERPMDARGLELLLALEGRARDTKSVLELQHFIVNETRKLTGARQIFLFQRTVSGSFEAVTVSSMALSDPDSPLLRWAASIANDVDAAHDGANPLVFRLPKFSDEASEESKSYPFKHMVWQPLRLPSGEVFAGLLQARSEAWRDNDLAVSHRLASVFAHTWAAHTGLKGLRRKRWLTRRNALIGAICVLLAGLIPVPLTVLAPVEVVARDPFVVAAPIDGIIEEIVAKPNALVGKDDLLLRYVDTTLRNKTQMAARELSVAEAGYRQAVQGAFTNDEARHQMAITRAEVDLKKAEYDFAREVLAKSNVAAPMAGLAILSNKDYWKGRPVKTGEQILKIADPDKIAFKIDLPVADAIVLHQGADVRVFLDAQPLTALGGKIERASYQGKANAADQLSYDVRGRFSSEGEGATSAGPKPRIGARGTAQVFGDTVTLAFYLFRRPLAMARQYLGL